MSVPDPTASRVRRRLGILAMQVTFALAGLALLEVGTRGYLWMRGKPYDAVEVRRQAQHLPRVNREFLPKEVQDQADAAPVSVDAISLHPYLGWEIDTGSDQIDGTIRSLEAQADPVPFRIVVVGGSVASAFCVAHARDNTLVECLSSDPEVPPRVYSLLNFARGGFKQPQQVNFLVYLLSLGFKPDIVINIDGFNEVALGMYNQTQGSHPVFPSAAHWSNLVAQGASDDAALDLMGEIRDSQRAIESWSERFTDWNLERSALIGSLALKRMLKLRGEIVSRFEGYARHLAEREEMLHMHGPRIEGDDQSTIEACVRVWKESSRSLHDICREHGILYLHVLQPTLHDKGSKPVTTRESEHGSMIDSWMRGVELGYPRLRREGQDLRRLGVEFVDASMLFANHPEELYYDACHFVDAGHVLLAKQICRELQRCLKKGR